MLKRLPLVLSAVFALMALFAGSVQAATWSVTDLGTFGGSSIAYDVNDSGQVAGEGLTTTPGETHAFRWTQGGGMLDLGTLGGTVSRGFWVTDDGRVFGESTTVTGETHAFSWMQEVGMADLGTLGGTFSYPQDVNAGGQVVGQSYTALDESIHAFSWTQAGGMVDLETLGGGHSIAWGVSDDGQVVGESVTATLETHAFSWTQAGGMVDLGTLGGDYSAALAVNDNGQVVGQSRTAAGEMHAFSWTPASGMMVDLGTMGASSSTAYEVNETGRVIGTTNNAGGSIAAAFSWTQAGGMVDLGSIRAGDQVWPRAVNASGQVVGRSTQEGASGLAFSWTQEGGIVGLNTLGGDGSDAFAVNDDGEIVGASQRADQQLRATLWQPLTEPDTTIDSGPPSSTTATSAVFEFSSATPTASFECKLDSGVYAPCTSPKTYSSLAHGQHTFSVRALDSGTPDSSPAQHSWAVVEQVSATVAPGGTASSGTDPTPQDPMETSVTSPTGGSITFTEQPENSSLPSGWSGLGWRGELTAPAATPENPLVIVFRADASILPSPLRPIAIFKDGVEVPFCANPSSGVANPDPCIKQQQLLANGDGEATVLSSSASTWDLAVQTTSYPRPKGATPMRVSLVPAYQECVAPNRTHGPPLDSPSCNPPQQASSQLTVGAADSNGKPVKSVGFVRLTTLVGAPSTPADEADVQIKTSITDVRRSSDLSDYTGELQTVLSVRLTDRVPAAIGHEPQTGTDFPFRVTVPCAPTEDTTTGSTCALTTTADTVVPGAVPELKRSIWALDKVQVFDGGADSDADTLGDNTLFMTQGVFVP